MNFYYRSLPEGRCEIVCTRCFRTVGAARHIEEMCQIEELHECGLKRVAVPVPPLADSRGAVPGKPRAVRGTKAPTGQNYLLLSAAALFLYVVPTLIEFTMLRNWSPWIAVVIPGDLAGCFCLAVVFRKVRTGIALYCVMTMIEAGFCWLHVTPLHMLLPWITDLVPTLVVFAMLWRSPDHNAKLVPII